MSLILTLFLLVALNVLPAAMGEAQVLCPDGRFHAPGNCKICPDGSWTTAPSCQIAPSGRWIPDYGGGSTLTPDGRFDPDVGGTVLCPDGRRYAGKN